MTMSLICHQRVADNTFHFRSIIFTTINANKVLLHDDKQDDSPSCSFLHSSDTTGLSGYVTESASARSALNAFG